MNEELEVRGCYNVTFICTPTRKQCRLSPESDTLAAAQNCYWLSTCYCRDTGGKRTQQAQRTHFNTLDNWGHKTPTQSKRIKDRKEKIKGSWPRTCIQYTWLHTQKKNKFGSENSALPLDSDSKPWSVILKWGEECVCANGISFLLSLTGGKYSVNRF